MESVEYGLHRSYNFTSLTSRANEDVPTCIRGIDTELVLYNKIFIVFTIKDNDGNVGESKKLWDTPAIHRNCVGYHYRLTHAC